MSNARLTLLATHDEQLQSWLQGHPQGHERAALVLMRRFRHVSEDLSDSDRYLVVEVHPVVEDWIISSGVDHIEFATQHMRHLMQACEERGLTLGFAHSHPSGYSAFSEQDERNELGLLKALYNRNGPQVGLVALLLCDGQWYGRVRHASVPDVRHTLRHVLVLANPLRLHTGSAPELKVDPEVWARQRAAFGEPFQHKLQSLRLGVMGAGGTGSASISMAARCGVQEMVLVDYDELEASNLNRVRGARKVDVGRSKVQIARDFVHALGLGTSVHIEETIADTSLAAVDAFLACDVVLGNSDDVLGRCALNALAFRHGVLVIDIGLGGMVADQAHGYRFYQQGRITTLLAGVPGYHCMQCEGVYSQKELSDARFLRARPHASEQELKENYITGGRSQAPGVGPFTSALAEMGLMQLYDLLQDFRLHRTHADLRRSHYKIDFVSLIASSTAEPTQECDLCHYPELTAVGQLPPGVLNDKGFRLGWPALGALPRYE